MIISLVGSCIVRSKFLMLDGSLDIFLYSPEDIGYFLTNLVRSDTPHVMIASPIASSMYSKGKTMNCNSPKRASASSP